MNKKKLGKSKNSINNLDANKSNSGVLDTEMAIMYNLSNVTNDLNENAIDKNISEIKVIPK
ncbi:hypothetical protein [Clostridium sp.]|jgi:hypothetical protein|uniref:hypothetical protein n=1 Tax=Clostridium sp. TaxID=1506 RepID=UPI003EE9AFDA